MLYTVQILFCKEKQHKYSKGWHSPAECYYFFVSK